MTEPKFPMTIVSSDGDRETVTNREELGMALEWYDSRRDDRSVWVVDADGRLVSLKVEALDVKWMELAREGR